VDSAETVAGRSHLHDRTLDRPAHRPAARRGFRAAQGRHFAAHVRAQRRQGRLHAAAHPHRRADFGRQRHFGHRPLLRRYAGHRYGAERYGPEFRGRRDDSRHEALPCRRLHFGAGPVGHRAGNQALFHGHHHGRQPDHLYSQQRHRHGHHRQLFDGRPAACRLDDRHFLRRRCRRGPQGAARNPRFRYPYSGTARPRGVGRRAGRFGGESYRAGLDAQRRLLGRLLPEQRAVLQASARARHQLPVPAGGPASETRITLYSSRYIHYGITRNSGYFGPARFVQVCSAVGARDYRRIAGRRTAVQRARIVEGQLADRDFGLHRGRRHSAGRGLYPNLRSYGRQAGRQPQGDAREAEGRFRRGAARVRPRARARFQHQEVLRVVQYARGRRLHRVQAPRGAAGVALPCPFGCSPGFGRDFFVLRTRWIIL